MANKFSVLFAFAAFVVAWLSGLAAGVPPDSILLRSLAGAAGFYLLGTVLYRVAATYLGLPGDASAVDEHGRSKEQPGTAAAHRTGQTPRQQAP